MLETKVEVRTLDRSGNFTAPGVALHNPHYFPVSSLWKDNSSLVIFWAFPDSRKRNIFVYQDILRPYLTS
jgi:hypothetical protein